MPQTNKFQKISYRAPEAYSEKIITEIENYSKHEDSRKKVKEIVYDCIGQVSFMDKVRSYARRELDERIFKNGTLVLLWFISVIVSAVLGAIITKLIK